MGLGHAQEALDGRRDLAQAPPEGSLRERPRNLLGELCISTIVSRPTYRSQCTRREPSQADVFEHRQLRIPRRTYASVCRCEACDPMAATAQQSVDAQLCASKCSQRAQTHSHQLQRWRSGLTKLITCRQKQVGGLMHKFKDPRGVLGEAPGTQRSRSAIAEQRLRDAMHMDHVVAQPILKLLHLSGPRPSQFMPWQLEVRGCQVARRVRDRLGQHAAAAVQAQAAQVGRKPRPRELPGMAIAQGRGPRGGRRVGIAFRRPMLGLPGDSCRALGDTWWQCRIRVGPQLGPVPDEAQQLRETKGRGVSLRTLKIDLEDLQTSERHAVRQGPQLGGLRALPRTSGSVAVAAATLGPAHLQEESHREGPQLAHALPAVALEMQEDPLQGRPQHAGAADLRRLFATDRHGSLGVRESLWRLGRAMEADTGTTASRGKRASET
mmetsp:Transcript_80521/g.260839  ORF Transcript_80521/g.260839 Transcript_80521/m.260839 type:complete len:438 (+) Transcript_80521:743-2056(+)